MYLYEKCCTTKSYYAFILRTRKILHEWFIIFRIWLITYKIFKNTIYVNYGVEEKLNEIYNKLSDLI